MFEGLWSLRSASLRLASLLQPTLDELPVIALVAIVGALLFAKANLERAEYVIDIGADSRFARIIVGLWTRRPILVRSAYAWLGLAIFFGGFLQRTWVIAPGGALSMWLISHILNVPHGSRGFVAFFFCSLAYVAGVAARVAFPDGLGTDIDAIAGPLHEWIAKFGWPLAWVTVATTSTALLLWLRIPERLKKRGVKDIDVIYPGIAKTGQAIIQFAVSTIWSAIFSFCCLVLWNVIAPSLGYETFQLPLVFRSPMMWVLPDALLRFAPFFMLAISFLLTYTAVLILRSWRAPLHDLFISYKSEDAALARGIADQLRAAGLRVWFAEYEVLLHERDKFQNAIARAISDCRFGLAITNNRWAQSQHCDYEIKRLLRKIGPEHILELRIPPEELPHARNPELARSKHLGSHALEEILPFISGGIGMSAMPPPPHAPGSGRRYHAVAGGRPCSLVVDGWTLERGETEDLKTSVQESEIQTEKLLGDHGLILPRDGWSLSGHVFTYNSTTKIKVNIIAGPELSRAGQRLHQTIDDREMYEEMMDHVRQYAMLQMLAKVRGVHLLFLGGLSQFAVTYRIYGSGYWTRKVSIILSNPTTGNSAEFVFTFGFIGSFAEYCRYAHVMDSFCSFPRVDLEPKKMTGCRRALDYEARHRVRWALAAGHTEHRDVRRRHTPRRTGRRQGTRAVPHFPIGITGYT